MRHGRGIGLLPAIAVAIGLVCGWTGGAAAADYPTRPINFLVGYTPGSAGDVILRPLAEAAGKILGQPIVVLNRPGAATSLSMAQLKSEKPDGYTLGLMVGSSIMNPHLEKMPYDVNTDYTTVIKFADFVMGVVVHTDSQWKTMQELLTYAKANPGKIKFSYTGSVNQMTMTSLAQEAGVKWVPVAHKGSKEAAVALLGKHVDVFAGGGDWAPYVASGEFRLIATYGARRYSMFPNTPTFVDMGYRTWMASPCVVVAPRGLPEPIAEKLHAAFKAAMTDPGFLRAAKTLTMESAYGGPADASREVKALDDIFAKFVKELDLK
jgi:tripartite-type tricarboxylate transporter receptor subunit TctC